MPAHSLTAGHTLPFMQPAGPPLSPRPHGSRIIPPRTSLSLLPPLSPQASGPSQSLLSGPLPAPPGGVPSPAYPQQGTQRELLRCPTPFSPHNEPHGLLCFFVPGLFQPLSPTQSAAPFGPTEPAMRGGAGLGHRDYNSQQPPRQDGNLSNNCNFIEHSAEADRAGE